MLGVLGVEARLLRCRVRLNTEVISYQDSPKQPSLTTAGTYQLDLRKLRRLTLLSSRQTERSFSLT
jgi:hypothetical protein